MSDLLDSVLLNEEVRAYPFRIRVQELACLFPGLRANPFGKTDSLLVDEGAVEEIQRL